MNHAKDFRWQVERARISGGYEVYAWARATNDRTQVVASLEVRTVEAGEHCGPSFTLTEAQAQQLIDDLWHTGLRPADAKDTTELVAAIKFHRDDAIKMRDLLMAELAKPKMELK